MLRNQIKWIMVLVLSLTGVASAENLMASNRLECSSFSQRKAEFLIPEDPLVLEWLKQIQDTSSPEQQLLPAMEGNSAQTFNNALVALAFIVKNEKARAERILDFYAAATNTNNTSPTAQQFYLNGEARGFFQHVALRATESTDAYHTEYPNDRWMGDMAWLLIAYKQYEKIYNSDRYSAITAMLKDLLISWYIEDPERNGGYVQHGWRNGDTRLHEDSGHHEGNIDCYAVFKMCGEHEKAAAVRDWLSAQNLGDAGLPLDLYTWSVLAYEGQEAHVLDIPEHDLRYRKTLEVNGRQATGFFHSPANVDNVWLDGVGHMACAYFASGNPDKGRFYSNQMDAFIVERIVDGVTTHALPYTANQLGGYDWVDTSKGFVSCAAWYIFSKNAFNPFVL
ncbi:MAG: hypothetical protein JEZ10_08745 [Verrucomicrobia bacterium]|nr:hypothetical protein [Verrucomicrobiota bacterium]